MHQEHDTMESINALTAADYDTRIPLCHDRFHAAYHLHHDLGRMLLPSEHLAGQASDKRACISQNVCILYTLSNQLVCVTTDRFSM